eukprot:TRINITY_DN103138_c0_g1_i1.p1 TRINITY_DN103138_c0_g1~~TRINITY_DN103138_c0_g1_i1.p1  ORF type:complete len:266 (+),score=59.07 TRINITY_DN103138_c0_g1_i1:39-800(+)
MGRHVAGKPLRWPVVSPRLLFRGLLIFAFHVCFLREQLLQFTMARQSHRGLFRRPMASCKPARCAESNSDRGLVPRADRDEKAAIEVQRQLQEIKARAGQRQPGRIAGSKVKPPSVVKTVEKEDGKSQFPLAAAGLAVLAALAVFAATRGSGEPEAMPTDAYYVSSSSTVIQSSRGEDGQMRTKVQDDSGVWTNIPGLKGKPQQRQQIRKAESLRAAQEEMAAAQAEVDQALDEMNREMESVFGGRLLSGYGF